MRPSTEIPVSSTRVFTVQLGVRELPVEAVVEVSPEFASLTKQTALPQLIVEASVTPTNSKAPMPTKRLLSK